MLLHESLVLLLRLVPDSSLDRSAFKLQQVMSDGASQIDMLLHGRVGMPRVEFRRHLGPEFRVLQIELVVRNFLGRRSRGFAQLGQKRGEGISCKTK